MNLKTSRLSIAVISDVHLGHRRTPTSHIIDNLLAAFPDDPVTANLDIIFIAGDLFDQALNFSDEEIPHIERWIIKFVLMCSKYDIILRILEGTPLHDRKQSRNIIALNEGLTKPADIKYISKLSIEYLTAYDMNVLYIPDEWKPHPDATWKDATECLSKHGLKSVDIGIMHGMFEHQIPPGCHVEAHKEARYSSIVDRYVFIGHIHQKSHRGKILAPGSFDRLTHGDEGKKGHWRGTLHSDKNLDNVTFVENKNPFTYMTIDCAGLGFESAISKLTKLVNCDNGSYCRIMLKESDSARAILEWAKQTYPTIRWSKKAVDSRKKISQNTRIIKHEVVSITPTNVMDQVSDILKEKGTSETITRLALDQLNLVKEL